MKKSTKNKSLIAAIAAVMAITSMSSCSNDSPSSFNAAPGQGFGAAEATTSAKAATHHIGDTIKKHVDGYGDAVFTCISSKAPFYFVHTSDRQYSASEMDAMHYQQNPLAVDEKMFNNIADVITNDWTLHYISKDEDYNKEKVTKYMDDFDKLFSEKTQRRISHYIKFTHFFITTEEIWVRNPAHEYPMGSIRVELQKGYQPEKNVSMGYSAAYIFTPNNRLMFAFTE